MYSQPSAACCQEYIRQQKARSSSGSRGPGVHQAVEAGSTYIRRQKPGSTSGSGSREYLHQKAEAWEYIRKQMYTVGVIAWLLLSFIYTKMWKKQLISSKKTLDNHQNSDIFGYEAPIIILYAFLTNKNDFWIHISHNLYQNAPKLVNFKKHAISMVSWRESL